MKRLFILTIAALSTVIYADTCTTYNDGYRRSYKRSNHYYGQDYQPVQRHYRKYRPVRKHYRKHHNNYRYNRRHQVNRHQVNRHRRHRHHNRTRATRYIKVYRNGYYVLVAVR